ncbi:MAG: general secretion pathway protein GspC [Bdellovibrionales bacterium]|nr:general secretion pathway protein GspC [Bdellovibrionales bacterium]
MDVFGRLIGSNQSGRPPLEGLYAYMLAGLVAYGVADTAILYVRPSMLAKKAPTARSAAPRRGARPTPKNYYSVVKRNIFNSKGEDPAALTDQGNTGDEDAVIQQQIATKTQLPLTLEGTIVHANPVKSVATVVAKNSNQSKAYQVDDSIENLVEKITKIERRRVEFINLQSGKLEFVEIPIDEKISLNMKGPSKPSTGKEEVVKRGEFDFELNRSDVKKYLSDLSGILSQARMTPNLGNDGSVQGFKFTGIQPGSVYEKLGFKVQDVIKSVNGEPVDSPTRAMELYNALKGQNYIELEVERNGRNEQFSYNINE